MNINKRKEDFVENFQNFLKKYQATLNEKDNICIESDACANQARTTAESFCKIVLRKKLEDSTLLSKLIQELDRKKEYIFDNDKNKMRNIFSNSNFEKYKILDKIQNNK